MTSFLETPEFQADLKSACRRAFDRLGFAQSTYAKKDLEETVRMRFFRWLDQYQGSPKCEPVIYKIACNLLIDAGRRHKGPRDYAEIDWANFDIDSLIGTSGKELETAVLLQECLNKLSSEEREAFVEYRLKGRTSREAGTVLGISAPTVIARYNRAIAELEKCVTR